MTDEQRLYIERRWKLTGAWPWVAGVVVVVLGCFLAFLFVRTPLLVNPFEVGRRVAGGELDEGTLGMLAVMTPVLFLTCFFLLGVLLALATAAFANERKFIAWLRGVDSTPPGAWTR